MQDFLIDLAVISFICLPLALIAFSIYRGDFKRVITPFLPPSELELRERANETMLRHERRALYERSYTKSNCDSEPLEK